MYTLAFLPMGQECPGRSPQTTIVLLALLVIRTAKRLLNQLSRREQLTGLARCEPFAGLGLYLIDEGTELIAGSRGIAPVYSSQRRLQFRIQARLQSLLQVEAVDQVAEVVDLLRGSLDDDLEAAVKNGAIHIYEAKTSWPIRPAGEIYNACILR